MYPLLQQAATPPYQAMFMRRNTCCITNQNPKQQQRWWGRKNTFCIANQNGNQNGKKQQWYGYSGRGQNEKQQRWRATDIVIDFGKYKGKMLGTLPPGYLKWMSENFRVGNCSFEGWAILADKVLADPIYQDRIEWQFAQNLLAGDDERSNFCGPEDTVGELEDIRDRFGWAPFDNHGWRKVKLELIGTSKGGRIPRLDDIPTPTLAPPKKPRSTTISSSRTKRMERRQQLKVKLKTTDEAPPPPPKQQQELKDESVPAADIKQPASPFPGRQALVRKALHHRAQS